MRVTSDEKKGHGAPPHSPDAYFHRNHSWEKQKWSKNIHGIILKRFLT